MLKIGLLACLAAFAIPITSFSQEELFIHNFHRVDDHVWRGAQPSGEGLRALAANGAKTILDLRPAEERTGGEKKEAESLGMKYLNDPMNGFHAPTDEQIQKALNTLADSSAWPVFVHCKYGEDRTGTVIACYRIKHDGWDNRKALNEARKVGMHPWERGMHKYILTFHPEPQRTGSLY